MTTLIPHEPSATRNLLRLSDLIKRPVRRRGEKIGTLCDLVIVDKGAVAEVTHVCIHQPFGRPQLFVPWRTVEELSPTAVVLDASGELESEEAPPSAVLLEDYIVDKKCLPCSSTASTSSASISATAPSSAASA
jgi:hypothetical protein